MKPVSLAMLLVFLFNAGALYLFLLCVWTGHPYNPHPTHFTKSIPDAGTLFFLKNLSTVAFGAVFFISTIRQLYLLDEDCGKENSFEACKLYLLAYMVSTAVTVVAGLFIIHMMGVHAAWTVLGLGYLVLMGVVGGNGITNSEYATALGIGYSLYTYAEDSKKYIEKKNSFKESLNTYLSTSKF